MIAFVAVVSLTTNIQLLCTEDGMEVEVVVDGDEDLNAVAEAVEGMCVECTDQPASLRCDQCSDDYCDVCFQACPRPLP